MTEQTHPCPRHGAHPHEGLLCALCLDCGPEGQLAAHELSHLITGPGYPQGVRRGPDGRIAVRVSAGPPGGPHVLMWVEVAAPNGQFRVWYRNDETVAGWQELTVEGRVSSDRTDPPVPHSG